MDDDNNKQDFKKGLSNSFVWFLMAAFLMALMVQNFIETKIAKVSFSYQLENLVNLDLIKPEYSRKIALNDNLVTFSGKFREEASAESKKRFKFLELLNENQVLTEEKQQTQQQLATAEEKVKESASWFLALSGLPIPANGYIVVNEAVTTDEVSDAQSAEKTIVVQNLPNKKVVSLADLKHKFEALGKNPTEEQLNEFGPALFTLVRNFRSPLLGVRDDRIKKELDDLMRSVAGSRNLSTSERVLNYSKTLDSVDRIVDELNGIKGNARLVQLRSVGDYKNTATQYIDLSSKLQNNEKQLEKAKGDVAHVIWFFNNKEYTTAKMLLVDPEEYHHWYLNAKEEWETFPQNKGGVFKAPDQQLNQVLEKRFKSEEPAPNYLGYLFTLLLPFLLIISVLYFIFSRQMKGMGSGAMNFGKSPAKLMTKEKNKTTFKDVAGIDEATEELEEIVEFLKNPKKFTALGGRIPKGVLCIGPPGTGKTLIAKAVAGEADRPFFSISGSDFVEMFVGVGASRIRDMFDQAKKQAPCIIFIDEIDAVGRHRGAGVGGGHDEREQTLNQLLVEMDGFDTNEGVILMAATNRPDVLDKALLRPGRFDRRIIVNLPDIKGRFEILKVHAKKIKLDPTVDLMKIARSTPGCSGADLANILNEAALLAARRGRTAVTSQETTEARDKVLYGKERRSMEIDESEKMTTAYHEAGHAIVSLHVEHADPVDKVTIIPRGFSLGSTMFLPEKNKTSYWKKELVDQLAVLMGGRAAEEIFVGDISSGAKQDIEHATQLARSMVCQWGMSDKMGLVAYGESSDSGYYGFGGHSEKHYSEDTARLIDEEVKSILDTAYERAVSLSKEHRAEIELMTKMLLKYETLLAEDVADIKNNTFSEEKAAQRRQEAEDAHKKHEPTPPPLPTDKGKGDGNLPEDPFLQRV